jgi:hypothetical protein
MHYSTQNPPRITKSAPNIAAMLPMQAGFQQKLQRPSSFQFKVDSRHQGPCKAFVTPRLSYLRQDGISSYRRTAARSRQP